MSKNGKHNANLKELALNPVEKKSVIEERFSFSLEVTSMLANASIDSAKAIALASIEAYGQVFSTRSFISKVREAGYKGDSAVLSKTFTFIRKNEGKVSIDKVLVKIDEFRKDKVTKQAKKTDAEKHLNHLIQVMKKSNDVDVLINVFEMLLDGGKVVPPVEEK